MKGQQSLKNAREGSSAQTHDTDHDLSIYLAIYLFTVDNFVPSSPAVARGCARSVYSTDPTQETCATLVLDHAGYATPTPRHELDHTRSGIYLETSQS